MGVGGSQEFEKVWESWSVRRDSGLFYSLCTCGPMQMMLSLTIPAPWQIVHQKLSISKTHHFLPMFKKNVKTDHRNNIKKWFSALSVKKSLLIKVKNVFFKGPWEDNSAYMNIGTVSNFLGRKMKSECWFFFSGELWLLQVKLLNFLVPSFKGLRPLRIVVGSSCVFTSLWCLAQKLCPRCQHN